MEITVLTSATREKNHWFYGGDIFTIKTIILTLQTASQNIVDPQFYIQKMKYFKHFTELVLVIFQEAKWHI